MRLIFLIKQLSKICLDIKAQKQQRVIKKKKLKTKQNVAKRFVEASTAHRAGATTMESNMAESEENSFAYENSWALTALD